MSLEGRTLLLRCERTIKGKTKIANFAWNEQTIFNKLNASYFSFHSQRPLHTEIINWRVEEGRALSAFFHLQKLNRVNNFEISSSTSKSVEIPAGSRIITLQGPKRSTSDANALLLLPPEVNGIEARDIMLWEHFQHDGKLANIAPNTTRNEGFKLIVEE